MLLQFNINMTIIIQNIWQLHQVPVYSIDASNTIARQVSNCIPVAECEWKGRLALPVTIETRVVCSRRREIQRACEEYTGQLSSNTFHLYSNDTCYATVILLFSRGFLTNFWRMQRQLHKEIKSNTVSGSLNHCRNRKAKNAFPVYS